MSTQPIEEKQHLSAHNLVKKAVEDQNFHVSEEDLKNIDTTAELTPSEKKAAEHEAENIEKDSPTTPYDILGK